MRRTVLATLCCVRGTGDAGSARNRNGDFGEEEEDIGLFGPVRLVAELAS